MSVYFVKRFYWITFWNNKMRYKIIWLLKNILLESNHEENFFYELHSMCIRFYDTDSLIIISDVFFMWMTIAVYNYLHMRNNFRTYYFDVNTLFSNDWRISHVINHHPILPVIIRYTWLFLQSFLYKDKSILMAQINRIISLIVLSPLSFFFNQTITLINSR